MKFEVSVSMKVLIVIGLVTLLSGRYVSMCLPEDGSSRFLENMVLHTEV
jgi:hypothetical protein